MRFYIFPGNIALSRQAPIPDLAFSRNVFWHNRKGRNETSTHFCHKNLIIYHHRSSTSSNLT